jgi:hypothetical protein
VSPSRRNVKCSSTVFALFVYVCTSFNEHTCNVHAIWPRTLSGEPQRRVAAITILRTTIDDIHIHASSQFLPDGLSIAHSGSRMDWVEASFNRSPRRNFWISHGSRHQIRLATEQVFDRRSAAKHYRSFAAEHGTVDSDVSCYETSCDGSPGKIPCYTTPESVLCRSCHLSDHNLRQSSPATPTTGEPRFLDQVANACRVKHLAYRTEQSYVAWVKRFILFHNKRHPREMGSQEVRAFLTHLARNRGVSASTQNQALNAIVFMYREVVQRDPGEFGEFQRAKRPKRLPTVLTRNEVQRVLAHLEGTYGLMARLLYGTGMRLMECVRLRIKDVDFTRGTITVRSGKGDKDRVTVLPEALREPLHAHIERLRGLHAQDREKNLPGVELPNAFAEVDSVDDTDAVSGRSLEQLGRCDRRDSADRRE